MSSHSTLIAQRSVDSFSLVAGKEGRLTAWPADTDRWCAVADFDGTYRYMSTATTISPNRLLTVEDVCGTLGISRSTWDKWRAKDTAPACKRMPNGSLRIHQADLDEWFAALPEAA